MSNPTPSPPSGQSFTGRTRKRTTRKSVLVADRGARFLISVGGIGTIVAVLGVFFFLVWVVVPLFLPASVEDLVSHEIEGGTELLQIGVDEYQLLGWTLRPSGMLNIFRLDDGSPRAEKEMFSAGQLTSSSFLIRGEMAAFGRRDGTVQLADVGFKPQIIDAQQLPATTLQEIESSEEQVFDFRDGVLEATPSGQYRFQHLLAKLGKATRLGTGPVHRITHVIGPDGPLVVALVQGPGFVAATTAEESAQPPPSGSAGAEPSAIGSDDPSLGLFLLAGEERSNFLTGETTLEFREPQRLPFEGTVDDLPSHVALAGAADSLYVAWDDGRLQRYDISNQAASYLTESVSLVEPGDSLTSLAFVLGNNTLLWGDSDGNVTAGFPVSREEFEGRALTPSERHPEDGKILVPTKVLKGSGNGTATSALGASARSRLVLTGYDNGEIKLFNVTHASQLMSVRLPTSEPILKVIMAPKEDGLLVATKDRIYSADLDPRHPEASLTALFRPVWYEGYSKPQHTWQSSSGTDDFETKLGLMPLIFGTLKATIYSMMFGAPLALLAAIFTSEFLHPRAKSVIKPGIELMASLPSVVLGFLAALTFAPFIEKVVPATLVSFLTLPLAFLLGAFLWQLLPLDISIRYQNWRFGLMALMLPLGILLALWSGPLAEDLLFAGDLKGWLAWNPGDELADRFANSLGGWTFLLLPVSVLVVMFLVARFVNPLMRQRSAVWDRRQFALMDLGKLLLGVVGVFALAFACAALLSSLGFDPRGSFVDTYVPRNALIVGFVMGFAVIPIIYTISEDALSTVPEHLRSASLGAGATPWQTATRIVVPTAMSGLFSALMVGLGRAVGETMIVLMAAGNTPVMEWNIFEGFRTLSANIAVELPEAVRNSTHYRTLFLAALVLFLLTFLVNTVAEVIRQRFRKRAYQL